MTSTATRSDMGRSGIYAGLALMVLAMLAVPSLDAFAKLLARHMPPLEIAVGRFAVQLVMVAAYALATGRARELVPDRLVPQLLRGVALAFTTLMFFTGLRVMPMADAIAIVFIEPVILTAFCAVFLKEKVVARRWVACGIGLIGGLVIVRPSLAIFGVNALFPLGSAVCFACYHLLNRHLAGRSSVIGAQFTTSIAGCVVLAPALLVTSALAVDGQTAILPLGSDLPLFIGMGLVSVLSHSLILMAYDRVAAIVLAPFGYLEIVSATLLGYVIFGDFPAWPTWIGITLIVGSGLYSIIREHQDMQPMEPAT